MLKCGIIGLPNVGKSTIFNKLTNAKAQAENYPFCTITPNYGTANIPDERLHILSNILNIKNIIHDKIKFIDIAGLIQGSHQGCGIGNKFLSHIREVDAIIHVVRVFKDNSIIHIANNINPISDICIINSELLLADIILLEKLISKIANNNKNYQNEEIRIYKELKNHLESNKTAYSFNYTKNQKKIIQSVPLLTNKPLLYVANISQSQNHAQSLNDIKKFINNKHIIIKICAHNNNILKKNLQHQTKRKYEEDQITSLKQIIRVSYKILKLITFFTINSKEIRAWTINNQAQAQQAAKKIHTDIKKGFIKAEVINFYDYIKHKKYQEIKNAGKIHLEGRNYCVQDGDIINFRFNL